MSEGNPWELRGTLGTHPVVSTLHRVRGAGYLVRGESGWVLRSVALAGADISRITGPIRSLAERVAQATQLGAVVDGCCGRGGHATDDLPDEDEEDE